ncbi:MAG TPA: hypothetical protein VGX76_00650 [Pirellulales bacterium]|jgi:DNA-binding NtrC family response regulator|nr:hypothetical protein [Pirellulales bacterium]
MQPATLVFCERTGRWAVAWRTMWARAAPDMADRPLRIVETRSAAECRETLAGMPDAFVAIELTPAGADIALELLAEVTTNSRHSPMAVLAEHELADYEWLARELGAVHFIASPRQLPSLTGIVCRHAARTPATEMGLRESVWSRLPWST